MWATRVLKLFLKIVGADVSCWAHTTCRRRLLNGWLQYQCVRSAGLCTVYDEKQCPCARQMKTFRCRRRHRGLAVITRRRYRRRRHGQQSHPRRFLPFLSCRAATRMTQRRTFVYFDGVRPRFSSPFGCRLHFVDDGRFARIAVITGRAFGRRGQAGPTRLFRFRVPTWAHVQRRRRTW